MRKTAALILLTFLAMPAGAAEASASGPIPICDGGRRISCIVDGDTLWLNHKKIRLEDIDAPEISEPRCAAELALGEKAKLRLEELLNAGPFTVAQVGDREHDVYGRELRTLSVGGRSVGQILVDEGLAHEWVGHKLPWC